jgi:hypothetical protein
VSPARTAWRRSSVLAAKAGAKVIRISTNRIP